MSYIHVHIHQWAITLLMILTVTACNLHDEFPAEQPTPTGERFLLIKTHIAGVNLGEIPASRAVESSSIDPQSKDWKLDTQPELLEQYNLTDDKEFFIGNLRIFLLNADGGIVYTQSFQQKDPDITTSGQTEGVFMLDDAGNATISMDVSSLIGSSNELSNVKSLIVVANQPYENVDNKMTNLYFPGLKNAPPKPNFFSVYGQKLISNPILTEADLQEKVGRTTRPYGLTMIGGITDLDFTGNNADTKEKVKSFNQSTEHSVTLYRNVAKMVVDVLNPKEGRTEAQKFNHYLGAEVTGIPTQVQLLTPIINNGIGVPMWSSAKNGLSMSLPSLNENASTTKLRLPYLEKGNYATENPESVRYVYYTGVFDYGTIDRLPKITFYTSVADELQYVKNEDGSTNMVDLADRAYTMKLFGNGAAPNAVLNNRIASQYNLHQTFSNRINYYQMRFNGDTPSEYNVIFVPIGGETSRREVFIGGGSFTINEEN